METWVWATQTPLKVCFPAFMVGDFSMFESARARQSVVETGHGTAHSEHCLDIEFMYWGYQRTRLQKLDLMQNSWREIGESLVASPAFILASGMPT